MRQEDSSKNNPVKKLAIKPVINEIALHYHKANIQMVNEVMVAKKITALHKDYDTIMKLNPEKKIE